MKKSLLALAVLGTFAGLASAQSSVKLDGTVDLNLRTVKNGSALGGAQQKSMSQDGINSSQFRVSGVEDLGGGLKAGFNLNSGVNADTGTSNAQFWNRRATVSLMGGFGEIRMGRDYTPTFWNQTLYDPFGTNGIGTTTLVYGQAMLGTNAQTRVRADNALQYWTPAMGGFEAQVMITPNEGATTTGNKYTGVRVGFAAGPLSLGASMGQTTVGPVSQADDKLKLTNFAGSYKFGPAKVNFIWAQSKTGALKEANFQLGTNIAMGQGELRAAYNKVNHSGGAVGSGFGDADDSTHLAIGYVYNLSTRTALYGTYATLKNKGVLKQTIAGSATGMLNGEKSSGAEFGLRHFF
jgi:predicted porin